MKSVGDLVGIWSGEGEFGDPKRWMIGFVVEKVKRYGGWNYRVFWNDMIPDKTLYAERDIDLDGWKKP